MAATRVAVVGRSESFRASFTSALARHPNVRIVAVIVTAIAGFRILRDPTVDVVVLEETIAREAGDALLAAHPRVVVVRAATVKSGASRRRVASSRIVTVDSAAELMARFSSICRGALGASESSGGTEQPCLAANHEERSVARESPRLGFEILLLGSSTGGPDALASLFAGFTGPLPVPALICQHMPPVFTARLAERLDRVGPNHVREGTSKDVLVPGAAVVAPGGMHLCVEVAGARLVAVTRGGPQEHGCRPAVDVLFKSVARIPGVRALAVVLTGMGADGAAGAVALASAGGEVFAQDKETSVVWGMPRVAIATGVVRRVLPIHEMAEAIELALYDGNRRRGVG